MSSETRSNGHAGTGPARCCMTRPCKRVGHTIPAKVAGNRGTAAFWIGAARLSALDTDLACLVAGCGAVAIERLHRQAGA